MLSTRNSARHISCMSPCLKTRSYPTPLRYHNGSVTAGTETTQAATFEKTSGWETTATVEATNGFASAHVTASYSEEVNQTFRETISLST